MKFYTIINSKFLKLSYLCNVSPSFNDRSLKYYYSSNVFKQCPVVESSQGLSWLIFGIKFGDILQSISKIENNLVFVCMSI